MEAVGENVAPTALALNAGLDDDYRPVQRHRPDVLLLPDDEVAAGHSLPASSKRSLVWAGEHQRGRLFSLSAASQAQTANG